MINCQNLKIESQESKLEFNRKLQILVKSKNANVKVQKDKYKTYYLQIFKVKNKKSKTP